MTSRELAERIEQGISSLMRNEINSFDIGKLIDRYVKVKESEARREQHAKDCHFQADRCRDHAALDLAVAQARAELEKRT
jgi:hypothetical protein